MHWYLRVLEKYADFTGRARRMEYWCFYLVNIIVIFTLGIIDVLVGAYSQSMGVGLLSSLYSLGVLIPGFAVLVRRLHDTGRSGWWVLIGVIPVLGVLVLLVFTVLDSDVGTNAYGTDPTREDVT